MTTTVRDLDSAALAAQLRCGLRLQIGPFTTQIHSTDKSLAALMAAHYPAYALADPAAFTDMRIEVRSAGWLRKTGRIMIGDGTPFSDFPMGSELPNIEWSINWCVATRAHQYFMLHAGVLERDGRALLLPGLPAAGKSTLSVYLMHHGWRLLSDEFTLLDTERFEVTPYPRLIPLKNDSIDIIRTLVPAAAIGPSFTGTRKGTVAHVRPLDEHVRQADQVTRPGLIVFPTFRAGVPTSVVPMPESQCFIELTKNAFNYRLRGLSAFRAAADMVDELPAYRLVYSELPDVAQRIRELALEHAPASQGHRTGRIAGRGGSPRDAGASCRDG